MKLDYATGGRNHKDSSPISAAIRNVILLSQAVQGYDVCNPVMVEVDRGVAKSSDFVSYHRAFVAVHFNWFGGRFDVGYVCRVGKQVHR